MSLQRLGVQTNNESMQLEAHVRMNFLVPLMKLIQLITKITL